MQQVYYHGVVSCKTTTSCMRGEKMEKILSFKAWMAANGVKQKDLAKLLGLSLNSTNMKVNGKLDFSLEQIKVICSTYGISADIFL